MSIKRVVYTYGNERTEETLRNYVRCNVELGGWKVPITVVDDSLIVHADETVKGDPSIEVLFNCSDGQRRKPDELRRATTEGKYPLSTYSDFCYYPLIIMLATGRHSSMADPKEVYIVREKG